MRCVYEPGVLRTGFGEVAGAVAQLQVLFAQLRVRDLERDFAVGAVAAFVGR